jgi:hypothetical protein
MFINLDILDKPFDDFFMRVVVVLNVFIQLFAQRQIFGLQLFLGFPPGVRVYPVLNALDLITGSQVYEFLDVCTVVVFDPFIRLHVHGFALGIRAVNGALVHVHALQIVHDDGADPLNEAVVPRKFQIFQRYIERFYKITELNGVLAFRIQEYLQVELLIIGRVVCVIYYRISLFAQFYDLSLQRFVLLHELFHHLHHEFTG